MTGTSDPEQTPAEVPTASASRLLRRGSVWVFPSVLASVVMILMTVLYLAAVVDPVGHMHGLPVSLVDEDAGAASGSHTINSGQAVTAGLLGSPAVSDRLDLKPSTLAQAKQRMDAGKSYATVVIPRTFSSSLLQVAGMEVPTGAPAGRPTIEVLTNQRAGTEGVSLSTGVLHPALEHASRELGEKLLAADTTPPNPAARPLLVDPVAVTTVAYLPLPSHAALGLSAFYISLLTMMCGFIAATILNVSIDGELGYAPTEIGPRWRLLSRTVNRGRLW